MLLSKQRCKYSNMMVNNLLLPSRPFLQLFSWALRILFPRSLSSFFWRDSFLDSHATRGMPPSHSGTHSGLCLGVTFYDHPIENNASFLCHQLSPYFDFYSFNELTITWNRYSSQAGDVCLLDCLKQSRFGNLNSPWHQTSSRMNFLSPSLECYFHESWELLIVFLAASPELRDRAKK